GPEPTFALAVFALNPLVLIELVGNAHNDGVLLLFGLLAIRALQADHERRAVGFALLAALVKMPGILWLAGVVVLLMRRRRWRILSEALFAGVCGSLVMLWEFRGSFAAMTVLNGQFQYAEDSLHTLIIDVVRALSRRRFADYDAAFMADRL